MRKERRLEHLREKVAREAQLPYYNLKYVGEKKLKKMLKNYTK